MSNPIVVNGTKVVYDSPFLHHSVTPLSQGTIMGTGHASVSGKKVCVNSDISGLSTKVQATYTTGPYTSPGTGELSIMALQPDQLTAWCLSPMPVITMGTKFIAFFRPITPATLPVPPNTPDLMIPAVGTGSFQTNPNTFVTAG